MGDTCTMLTYMLRHIMKMDERDTGLLTLYMPFKIESNSDQYQIYFEEKQRQLTEFREAQRMRPIDKVRPLKAMAPMLVRCKFRICHEGMATNISLKWNSHHPLVSV